MIRNALVGLALFAALASGAEAKTYKIAPGPTAESELQAAISTLKKGDAIAFKRGQFDLTQPLTIAQPDVTVRGEGVERTVLSFRGQTSAGPSLRVTGSGAELQDFVVRDAPGDALALDGANGAEAQELVVEWTQSQRGNGPRGLSVLNAHDVLVDHVAVRGASEAGIFVGASQNIVVQKNRAERNVAGILVANSAAVDVIGNIANDNAIGIAVANFPDTPVAGEGGGVRVTQNEVVTNNGANFAAGGPLARMPSGIGVLALAARSAAIVSNTIGEHNTANVMIAAWADPVDDAAYDPLPHDVVVRANTFGRTGLAPAGDLAALPEQGFKLPDILWDGASTFVAAGLPKSEPVRLGILQNVATRTDPVTFLSLGLPFASSPMSEIMPDPAMPSAILIPEPGPVKLKR